MRTAIGSSRFKRALMAVAILALALLASACGGGEEPESTQADQDALEQARQEGAQQARQNARIKALQQKLKESDEQPAAPAPTSTPPSIAPPSAASSYVPTYTSFTPSDPNYAYVAEIPTGGGWSAPAESYPTGASCFARRFEAPTARC